MENSLSLSYFVKMPLIKFWVIYKRGRTWWYYSGQIWIWFKISEIWKFWLQIFLGGRKSALVGKFSHFFTLPPNSLYSRGNSNITTKLERRKYIIQNFSCPRKDSIFPAAKTLRFLLPLPQKFAGWTLRLWCIHSCFFYISQSILLVSHIFFSHSLLGEIGKQKLIPGKPQILTNLAEDHL